MAEWEKKLGDFISRNPNAGICDTEEESNVAEPIIIWGRLIARNLDRYATIFSELDSIADQVGRNLSQPSLITVHDHWHVGRDLSCRIQAILASIWLE